MDEHNNGAEKFILLVKCGLILMWYYASSLIVSGAVYARLKDEAVYTQYVNLYENKLMIVIYLILFFGIWAFDRHKEAFIAVLKKWELMKLFKYILIGIGAYFVSNIITGILLPYFPDYENIGNLFKNKQILLSFISTVLLPPVIEEYLFRHKIQGYLKKAMNAQFAIVAQAVLFGILHGYAIQKIYATLIGAFFGYIDEKEGTVQCSIIMHITVNCIGWIIGCFLL